MILIIYALLLIPPSTIIHNDIFFIPGVELVYET
jgi:hypothetical protein